MLEVTLADSVQRGVQVLKAFQRAYDTHIATKDLLVRSAYHPEETADDPPLPEIVSDLSMETIKSVRTICATLSSNRRG